MAANNVEVKTIVVLYEQQDNIMREDLDAHLSSLKNENLITVVCDQDIRAGTEWKQQIKDNLDKANIILPLISSNFMASQYNYGVAMERALKRQARGEAHIIPIIVRPTDWERGPFGGLKALPTDAKPISTWEDRDEAFLDVVEELRKVIVPPSSQKPLSQPTSEKSPPINPPPLNEEMGTRTNEPNLPPMRKKPSLSLKMRIILSVVLVVVLLVTGIGFSLLLNRPSKHVSVSTAPSVSTSTAISPTPTIASLSPTSNATAMSPTATSNATAMSPTATPMPTFFPAPPQKTQPQPTPLPFMNWYLGTSDGACTYQNLNASYQDDVTKSNTGSICQAPKVVTHIDFDVQIKLLGDGCAGIVYDASGGDASYYDVIICPSLHYIAWKKRVSYNSPQFIGKDNVSSVSIEGTVDLHIDVKQDGTLTTWVNGIKVVFTDDKGNLMTTDTLGSPLSSGSFGIITVSLTDNSASASFSKPSIS